MITSTDCKDKMKSQKPIFDKMGFTQWMWRVLYKENLKLGKKTEIGSFTVIDAKNGVVIEDNVKIGWSCSIISDSTVDGRRGKVVLKSGCKIGANSVIMPGVTIGRNSVIGANSFVVKNVPDNEIWVGTPARKLKTNPI